MLIIGPFRISPDPGHRPDECVGCTKALILTLAEGVSRVYPDVLPDHFADAMLVARAILRGARKALSIDPTAE